MRLSPSNSQLADSFVVLLADSNPPAMEALLSKSRTMCPFLKKTSPATLRSLSTTTAAQTSSTGGSTMSNLQLVARRCPVMGNALAVQSARTNSALAGAFGGTRAYHAKVNRAKYHSTSVKEAQAVDVGVAREAECMCLDVRHSDRASDTNS